jgi:nucleoside-diphosphate-sugar epimerase
MTLSTADDLEEALSRPTPAVVEDLRRLGGDLVVLGASGKMGPTLARMARRALDRARKVIAVARFSNPRAREALDAAGVHTLACDLLDPEAVRRLPDAAAVVFMPGAKFGTSGAEAATWATNAFLPGLVAERYRGVPTVVFSTGNVYPLVPVASGGATEETPPAPIGEYAQSCLARERVFEFHSRRHGTPVVIYRLNYAVELRYGVLLDLAQKVHAGAPVDLRMGHFNAIWQGDANAIALRCLTAATSPPSVLNVTGPETLSVREAAVRLGRLLGRAPVFEGREEPTALLSNASKALARFGPLTVPIESVIEWVAHWVKIGGPTLGKPTHFETRDGRF